MPVPRRRWLIASLLGFGVFVNYLDRVNISVSQQALHDAFGVSTITFGYLLSGYSWTYAAMQLPSGVLLDRFGVRRVGCISTLLWSVASFCSAAASGVGSFFVARLLLGIGEAPTFPGNSKAVGYWFPDRERSLATAFFDSAAKLGPALAAGNTIVLKPAPDTPWCAAVLGEIITEHTDFPPGVVNIITSTDHGVGALLAKDPRVDMVSFTGSTATGRSVMSDAAVTLKKVFLELGGKSAFVVLDDADLNGACSVSAFTASMHAGQGCAITTRLVVPRAKYDEAVAIAAGTMGSIKPGDPNKPGTVCGPVISARQRDRVQSYLDLAIAEGGTFACGGGRPADRDTGFFIEPTVIAGLDNDARPAREEIFGPVLTVIAHDGDADALRIANDSPYGLSGTVFSADPERAAKFAAGMRVGTVNVNGGVWYSADAPFGGYKQSGNGREMGLAGFEEYLEIKTIATAV